MTPTELYCFWATKDRAVYHKKLQLMFGAGVVLGLLTPYGTSNIPNIFGQLAYWIGTLLFAASISGAIARWAFPLINQKTKNVGISAGIYAAFLSIPLFLIVIGTDIVVGGLFIKPQNFTLTNVLKYFTDVEYGILGYALWYGQVWLVTALIIGAVSLLHEKTRKPSTVFSAPPVGQLFLNRIPASLGTDLICLSMEDHYIRVHTEKGDTLILMRLADALKELEGYPGLQIHRSWWVASGAIKKVIKEKRKYTVNLSNGIQAPVSQTHVEKLRSAGFI